MTKRENTEKMNKRTFLGNAIGASFAIAGLAAAGKVLSSRDDRNNAVPETKAPEVEPKLITMSDIKNLERNPTTVTPIKMDNTEWEKLLDERAYYVLRKSGTERAGTSHLNAEKRKGQYVCAGWQNMKVAQAGRVSSTQSKVV